MVDLGILLSSINAAKNVAAKYEDLPLKSAILDALDKVLEVKQQVVEMQDELHAARRRIRDLEEQLAQKGSDPTEGLVFDRGVWWASESREQGPAGPFCPRCMDNGTGRRMMKRSTC